MSSKPGGLQFIEAAHDRPNELGDHGRPLVVLLGWVGCHPKHLLKYTQIWTDKGFDVFYYATTVTDFSLPLFRRYNAVKLLTQVKLYLEKKNQRCSTILFHIFSNGGGFTYCQFLRIIESAKNSPSNPFYRMDSKYFKGIVMDSLPTLSPLTGLRAIKMSMSNLQFAFVLLIFPIVSLLWIPFAFNYIRDIGSAKNKWLHLLLYSKTDDLVSYHGVDRFKLQLINNLGSKLIQSHTWDKSPHVLHYKVHPVEYLQKINNFLNTIKNQNNNQNNNSSNNKTLISKY